MLENNQGPKWHALYFQPSQIVFHVTGEDVKTSSEDLLGWANEIAKTQGLQISTKPRIQTFPRTLSAIEKQRRVVPDSESSRKRESHSLIYADLPGLFAEEDDLERLLDLIFLLDDKRQEYSKMPLEVVSPIWLTSGSSQPGATGGPGGRPTPYSGPSNTREHEFSFAKLSVSKLKPLTELIDPAVRGTGKGVTVAILDTAPQPKELDAIYAKWVDQAEWSHSLLRTLLDPQNRMLTVHADLWDNVTKAMPPPLLDLQCIGHDYDMNDHGLFVAGIIHSLAPQAQLHLYKVLNRYGVGNLEIIGEALKSVMNDFGDGNTMPLVINLSLNFAIPLEKGHTYEGKPDASDRIGLKLQQYGLERDNPSWLIRVKRMMAPFGDLLEDLGPAVIAAAGNDYDAKRHGKQRPEARYPAAFDSVVGVGALPRHQPAGSSSIVTASYSNLADKPEKSGITSLGGEDGEKNGVLGIYTGDFPTGPDGIKPPNNSGWGWWAGTSFATPIISGLVASVASSIFAAVGPATRVTVAQEAINRIYEAQRSITTAGEDVFFLPQGEPPIFP